MSGIEANKSRAPTSAELAWMTAHGSAGGLPSQAASRRRDVVEDVIGALERTDAACNVMVTTSTTPRARQAQRATEAYRTRRGARCACRRAGHHQGSAVRRRRSGARAVRRRSRTSCRRVDSAAVERAQGGRRDPHLQDHDLRVRLQADRRQPAHRHHAQSLGPLAHQRRLERWRRCGGRGRVRAAGGRHRCASARSACRPRSAACSASSRPSASCRARRASFRRPGDRSRIPARSRALSRTRR